MLPLRASLLNDVTERSRRRFAKERLVFDREPAEWRQGSPLAIGEDPLHLALGGDPHGWSPEHLHQRLQVDPARRRQDRARDAVAHVLG